MNRWQSSKQARAAVFILGLRFQASLASRAMAMDPIQPLNIVLLVPVYDDWPAVLLLVQKLDEVLGSVLGSTRILLVDDASLAPPPPFSLLSLCHIKRIQRLRLRRNLGHQRAIAIGLCHLCEEVNWDAVLVMDADGEDKPDDVPRLLQLFSQMGATHVVFAERTRRSESISFR